MRWLKPNRPAAHGSGPPVDLRTMAHLPGRLLYAEGHSTNQMADLPCTVLSVGRTDIVVEVAESSSVPPVETAVILEVAQQSALIQCFTSIKAQNKARLSLRVPAAPHILQRRRFPRIDLFLGITLRTPEQAVNGMASQMINLSIDGAACVLVEPLSAGTPVTLNLAAIGLHPPDADGTVVRCTPSPNRLWVIGIKFSSLLPVQELYLGKYISDYV
jgi:hypothetical protein